MTYEGLNPSPSLIIAPLSRGSSPPSSSVPCRHFRSSRGCPMTERGQTCRFLHEATTQSDSPPVTTSPGLVCVEGEGGGDAARRVSSRALWAIDKAWPLVSFPESLLKNAVGRAVVADFLLRLPPTPPSPAAIEEALFSHAIPLHKAG